MNIKTCATTAFSKRKTSFYQKLVVIIIAMLAFSILATCGIACVSATDDYIPGELYIYEDAEFGLIPDDMPVTDAVVNPGAGDHLPSSVDLSTDIYFPPITTQIVDRVLLTLQYTTNSHTK